MKRALFLSVLLAAPVGAVISHGDAPELGPTAPLWHEFPSASVSVAPNALRADVPSLPAALSGAAGIVSASGAAAKDSGPEATGSQAVGQSMGAIAAEVAPRLESAQRGDGSEAFGAGRDIEAALEGAKSAPTAATPADPASPAASGLSAFFNGAYASAAEAAKGARLPKPRFIEAWREPGGWQFHFAAGDRHVKVYARDGQPVGRAWIGDELKPRSSLALSPTAFSGKMGLSPGQAIEAGARRFGAPPEAIGLSLSTLPKNDSLWYVIDAEDGRRLALDAKSGAARPLASGLARERVEEAAQALAGQKGYPYSETEYNAAYAGFLDRLREQGATRAQLALFARLMDEAPIRGGRFNSWSGD